MVLGVVLLAVGLTAIGTGSAVTRRRLTEAFGSAEPEVLEEAEGSGVVPLWASGLVLGGWALALAGIVVVVFDLIG